MNTIHFQKWQGAGNDFIIIDNRNHQADTINHLEIKWLCDRHFGIGADGLMLIGQSQKFDFEMVYYNSDGYSAEMCGNGGRCIAAMASGEGIFDKQTTFLTTDGPHQAEIITPTQIRLLMNGVTKIQQVELPDIITLTSNSGIFLNTGVPHLVVFVEDPDSVDVQTAGRVLRNLEQFAPAGTNVNFVKADSNNLSVRTYERGVEGETLACGTGNVAAAIASEWSFNSGRSTYNCRTLGGNLIVLFNRLTDNQFAEVWLEGPAVKVFEGTVLIA
jgi:diaminopimelate epimerase